MKIKSFNRVFIFQLEFIKVAAEYIIILSKTTNLSICRVSNRDNDGWMFR